MSCDERVPDPKYNCPNRLSDGRHFTDYRPRCFTNYESLSKPMSSYDYRMYLTHNAEKIMEDKRQHAYKKNMCDACVKPSTMLAEKDIQVCDARKCSFPKNDQCGLGVGRKYGGEGQYGRDFSSCELPVVNHPFAPLQ